MSAGYAELPHLIRSHRYANRVMPWPEFQAREAIAALRSSLSHTGALCLLSSTAISMNLTNRIRVEFGFDDDGLLPADALEEVAELLLELHSWALSLELHQRRGPELSGLRAEMKRVVGGNHSFPSKGRKRGPRRNAARVKCWWEEKNYGNA